MTYTSSVYAWRVDLNFNSGTLGSNNNGFSDAAGKSYISATHVFEGAAACEMNINSGDTAFGTWGGIINHPTALKKGDEIWFRVRTYMPAGFNYNSSGEGSHLKFLRVHTQTTSGTNEGYDDWYINPKGSSIAHLFIFEGEQLWSDLANSSYAPVLDKWETYEMYLKLDNVSVDSGGQARIRVWKNGELLADITNRKTLSTASSISDRSHLFTYWNGGAPQTQKMYVDDIVLTSDTPSERDAKGNPFVGVKSPNRPLPPTDATLN